MAYPYASLIDGIDYATIEHYLHDPTSEIDYIVHVRDKEFLPKLAEYLDNARAAGMVRPQDISSLVGPWLSTGKLAVTALRPLLIPHESLIPSQSIPRDTMCYVIYLPPFYLSHTEGVFERMKTQEKVDTAPPRQKPKI